MHGQVVYDYLIRDIEIAFADCVSAKNMTLVKLQQGETARDSQNNTLPVREFYKTADVGNFMEVFKNSLCEFVECLNPCLSVIMYYYIVLTPEEINGIRRIKISVMYALS